MAGSYPQQDFNKLLKIRLDYMYYVWINFSVFVLLDKILLINNWSRLIIE